MNISEQLIVRSIEDKTMIINLKNGKVTVIDEIGTLFWESITKGISLENFIKRMQKEFDVEPELLEKDYNDFVQRMKAEEILW